MNILNVCSSCLKHQSTRNFCSGAVRFHTRLKSGAQVPPGPVLQRSQILSWLQINTNLWGALKHAPSPERKQSILYLGLLNDFNQKSGSEISPFGACILFITPSTATRLQSCIFHTLKELEIKQLLNLRGHLWFIFQLPAWLSWHVMKKKTPHILLQCHLWLIAKQNPLHQVELKEGNYLKIGHESDMLKYFGRKRVLLTLWWNLWFPETKQTKELWNSSVSVETCTQIWEKLF